MKGTPAKLVTQDDLTDLKYLITSKLVEEGLIPDCTGNDKENEVDCENAIAEVFQEYFKFKID